MHTSKRPIPASLLAKQANRLKNGQNDMDTVTPVEMENILSNSMDDIFNLFKPNVMTEEDEQKSKEMYQQTLKQHFQNGEFDALLVKQFGLQGTQLNTTELMSNFKKLQPLQLDLIKYSMNQLIDFKKDWNLMPNYLKQLQYYLSYGNYGPREHYNDFSNKYEKIKFKLDPLTKVVLIIFTTITTTALIKPRRSSRDDQPI
ncbi:similar to Saccharomyces cerevisiae YGL057C GEP7 Protein of unknown function [Maudiozyma barnettii]|uniref:Uncharacterized protein n=1 Tax=Maudiozyma barnettii TaxID=61262 RepID=A0A8H2ZIT3_9SACH|nr:Gep7p [Kazachstania barnettii]CAB4255842.1 similar to Saccharomyces cerevisiae YGL057C GEP7 Protein of unknown function [Kazachstania barnettii]CAD1784403.1 similar to Saccharomyces cerevisiae YGL057C GEP7 Protein of unknown function [Kazachstania barnettii]